MKEKKAFNHLLNISNVKTFFNVTKIAEAFFVQLIKIKIKNIISPGI